MSLILFPLKILSVPAKFIFGIVGVFLAACANALLVRYLVCWMAWNFGWTWVTIMALNILMVITFIFTFVASGEK
jgi:hypothetical protein